MRSRTPASDGRRATAPLSHHRPRGSLLCRCLLPLGSPLGQVICQPERGEREDRRGDQRGRAGQPHEDEGVGRGDRHTDGACAVAVQGRRDAGRSARRRRRRRRSPSRRRRRTPRPGCRRAAHSPIAFSDGAGRVGVLGHEGQDDEDERDHAQPEARWPAAGRRAASGRRRRRPTRPASSAQNAGTSSSVATVIARHLRCGVSGSRFAGSALPSLIP